jgi:hypothetical protein
MLFIRRGAVNFGMQPTYSFRIQASLLLGSIPIRIVSVTNGIGHSQAKGESYRGVCHKFALAFSVSTNNFEEDSIPVSVYVAGSRRKLQDFGDTYGDTLFRNPVQSDASQCSGKYHSK